MGELNVLIEPSLNCSRDGVFIDRALVRARPREPVHIMNATNQDQTLSEGTTIRHGESAVWAATIEDQEPEPRQNKQFSKQLREAIAGARPNLSIRDVQALEEHIADYQDFFETKGGEYGRTEKVYHRIDTDDARPIRQPPCRIPLAKQAEVNILLEDDVYLHYLSKKVVFI